MDRFLIKRPRLALNNPSGGDIDGESERIESAEVSDGASHDNDSVEAVGNVQPQGRVNVNDYHVNDVNSGDHGDRPTTDDVVSLPPIPAPALRQSASHPSSSKPKRKFNPKWREQHPWIRYDPVNDGMLCGVCIEFGVTDSDAYKKSRGAWTTVKVDNWKKALEKIKDHEQSSMHKLAKERQLADKRTRESGGVLTVAITGQTKNQAALKVKNRTIMKKLLRTTYYLCNAKSAHFTNFQDTLELQIENGLEDLQHFLDNAPKNACYTSNQIIEQYVIAIGIYLEKDILESLNSASYFTILLDESQDITTVEEMSVCARWVPPKGMPVERFLGCLPLKRTTAEVITERAVNFLKEKGIDVAKLRGQGYDGASTMSGKKTGVQQRMKIACSPKAIFVHCHCHVLQLALVSASKEHRKINEVLTTMMTIWRLFHFSALKKDKLEEMQRMLDHPEMKMIKPSDTRWIAYQRCVTAVRKSLVPLQACLEHFYAESGDPEAKGVLKTMGTLKFVATVHIMSDLLEPVTRLSRVMQAKALDNTYLKSEVRTCEEVLEALLANPAQGENAKNIKQACQKMGITCADESLDQFLTNAAVSYISTVINNIQSRFAQASHLLEAMSIFNPKLIPAVESLGDYGNAKLETLLGFYGSPTTEVLKLQGEEDQSLTVGPDVDKDETRVEWRAFKKLLASTYQEQTAREVLQDLTKSEMGLVLYPNLTKLVTISLCLPVSTATVERSFSDMKMIKTRLRSRISATNLDHLMRISIEGPPMTAVDFDAVLDIWNGLPTKS